MKVYKSIVCLMVCGVISSYGAGKSELRVGGTYLSPSGDLWESGGGANVQWRSAIKDNLSFGVSLGILKLDASTDEISGDEGNIVAGGQTGYYWGFVDSYEGDATMVPVGASIIYDIPLGQAILSLEGGLKYVFVSSSVKANLIDGLIDPNSGVVLPGSAETWQEDVEIGNNLLGTLGAQLTFPLNENVNLFLGAGYQFDITKSEAEIKSDWAEYDGASVTDSELGGFFAEAGIGIDF